MTKRKCPYTPDPDKWKCPEALQHSSADVEGKCAFCGRRLTSAMPPPVSYAMSDLTLSYGKFYDPDFDALTGTQIRNRYEMGQNP